MRRIRLASSASGRPRKSWRERSSSAERSISIARRSAAPTTSTNGSIPSVAASLARIWAASVGAVCTASSSCALASASSMRTRIAAAARAALRTSVRWGSTPAASARCATRRTSTSDFPVPGPPSTSSGVPRWVTASRCASVNPSRALGIGSREYPPPGLRPWLHGGRGLRAGGDGGTADRDAPRWRRGGRSRIGPDGRLRGGAGLARGVPADRRRGALDARCAAGHRAARGRRRPGGGRRQHARDRQGGRGHRLRGARAPPPRRCPLCRGVGGARRGRLRRRPGVRRDRPDRRLDERQARTLAVRRLDRGRRRADDGGRALRVRLRARDGRGVDGDARARRAAHPCGYPRSRGAGRRRGRARARGGRRAAQPARAARAGRGRGGAPAPRRRGRPCAHALGAPDAHVGLDRVVAVPARERTARRHGDAVGRALCRRRGGAADRPRERGARRVHGVRGSPRGAPRAGVALAGDRGAHGCRACRVGHAAIITGVIDWTLVRRIAESIAGDGGHAGPPAADLASLASDAEARVRAYTGLVPITPLPVPEMVSRRQWIDANVRSMRPVLDRVGARVGGGMGLLGRPARALTRGLLSAQVGGLTGLLAQRVLGQYDMPLLDASGPARLLLVGPNLGSAAERLDVDGEQLLQWVTLHELTHAAQFGSVPWLRLHLASLVREVVDTLEVKVDPSKGLRLPSTDDLRGWMESIRRGELVTLVIGRERRVLVDRIQATMAVVEGHAEHVMDAVGAEVIPSLDQLRAALEHRRAGRSGPMRLLERVLGFELKLRQYRDGKRFCDAVVQRVGIEGLNRVWSAPHALPTLDELVDPDAWIARTTVPFVTK